jgi:hypothetical protein
MIGKKVLWFVAATFVSFVVFAGIALPIEATGIFNSLTDQRLTSCEGESVIPTEGRRASSVQLSLSTIENEERLWQALGIDSYCMEIRSIGPAGSYTVIVVVRDHVVDRNASNCFDLRGDFEGYCGWLYEYLDHGLDYMTLQGEFDSLQYILERNVRIAQVKFDPIYHIPTFIFSAIPGFFDAWSRWELISFVRLP